MYMYLFLIPKQTNKRINTIKIKDILKYTTWMHAILVTILFQVKCIIMIYIITYIILNKFAHD